MKFGFHFGLMENDAKFSEHLGPLDVFLLISGFVLVFAMWMRIIWGYDALPDTIPSHFNVRGEVDGYGGKAIVVVIGGLATVLFVGLEILSRYPQRFNYPVKITAANRTVQYRLASRFVRVLNLSVMLVFLGVVHMVIESADGSLSPMASYFVPLVFALTLIPIVAYVLMASYSSRN